VTAATPTRTRTPRRDAEQTASAGDAIVADVVARSLAIADRRSHARRLTQVARPLVRRLDRCERLARSSAAGSAVLAPAAALQFAGEAIATAAIDGAWPDGGTRVVVEKLAERFAADAADVCTLVFRNAISLPEAMQLPPARVVELVLELLVGTGAVAGASLWEEGTHCFAAVGASARSKRMREHARAAIDGEPSVSNLFRTSVVERWDQPHAALVARTRSTAVNADVLLAEAAAAISPALERNVLFDRGAARERELVAATERRLVRLGFDLHDGPLQEIVAFAQDLRVARTHIEPLLSADDASRAGGCFDDLGARLEALDRDLRQIAHSVRSTTALDRPLAEALQGEADALERAGVATELTVTGDLDELTDSQRIVIYRVVQEALNNIRKHAEATTAAVRIRSSARSITVLVVDNGRGLPANATSCGRLGLAGVTERVRLLGGAVRLGNGALGGTEILATLPQWRASHDATAFAYAATA
jgi:signal transduction histidine kinase